MWPMSSREYLTHFDVRIVRAIGILHGISWWEPVGTRIEVANLTMSGCEGMTAKDLRVFEDLADRWYGVDERLRRLYSANMCRAVGAALFTILLGKSLSFPGMTYRCLQGLWVSEFGYPPSIELVPCSGSLV
jgi:hypothetical protein